ncbi:MAG: hypothetical protein JW863_06270 [Chitinispirillaceae bacterium]|nr:hypothetical protein [Chitinispirillaceae bacterium]
MKETVTSAFAVIFMIACIVPVAGGIHPTAVASESGMDHTPSSEVPAKMVLSIMAKERTVFPSRPSFLPVQLEPLSVETNTPS